jgi:putative transposase
MSEQRRQQRTYDHRLRDLVRETGDLSVATKLGVPRSTAAGWLRAQPQDVISLDVLDLRERQLQAEALKLRRRIRVLGATISLLLALLRMSGFRLEARPLSPGPARTALLRAVQRAREWLPLRAVLRLAGISPSRLNAWKAVEGCPPDRASCPIRTPNQLTTEEVFAIREMVTSTEYRHIPTSRLAILAQRLARVFASPTTWVRLVRERGWRRARQRVHPQQPRVGLRTTRPDVAWHVDTTVIRLLDGTKAYVFAVIDNFSRRILSFRVADRFEIGHTIAVLIEAARNAVGVAGAEEPPMLVVDGGVENFNGGIDELIGKGVLRRVLALTELQFSNSLIEAFWRQMKHQWLFMNTLHSVAAVRRHVATYVAAHNSQIPHSAFHGQTQDEMYFGTGEHVPGKLAALTSAARQARVEANRALPCQKCGCSSWPAPWPVETWYVDFALSPEPAAARIALPYLVAKDRKRSLPQHRRVPYFLPWLEG